MASSRAYRIATLTAVAVVLVQGQSAWAAPDTVIGFDEQPTGATITTQYKSQGLVLGRGVGGPSGSAPGVFDPPAPGKQLGLYEACGGEFCNPGSNFLSGRVDFARQKLRLVVTDADQGHQPGGWEGPITLRALNATGAEIAKVSPPPGAVAPFPLEVTSASQNIQFFEIGGVRAIDDISFDNPDTPPPPEFSIAADYGPFGSADSFNVVSSDSNTIKLLLNRFNFSTGQVELAVGGLPAGVTAAGYPRLTSGPDGTILVLKLAAAKSAPPISKPVTITATPKTTFAGATPKTLTFTLNVLAQSDLRVTGLEVTQGQQEQFQSCSNAGDCATRASLPPRNEGNPTAAVPYDGVLLVANRKTLVRVFANRKFPEAGGPTTGTTMELRGWRKGKLLSTLPLVSGPEDLNSGGRAHVTLPERTNPANGFLFTLPDAWTNQGAITLEATLVPELAFIGTAGATDCGTGECIANNRFRMGGIEFDDTGYVDVATARLWVENENLAANGVSVPCCFETTEGLQRFYPDPGDVLDYAEATVPFGDADLRYDRNSYYASIDATEILEEDADDRSGEAKDLLDDYADDYSGCESRRFCADQIMGLYGDELSTAGVMSGRFNTDDQAYGVGNYGRPDSVTHELSHGYYRVHASTSCGGDDDGQDGEDWPLGNRGYMDGIGTDTRNGLQIYAQRSLGAFGSANMGAANFQPNLWFDFMSYCRTKEGNDAGIWTSVKGWNDSFQRLRTIANNFGRRGNASASTARAASAPFSIAAPETQARAASAAANLLRVRATVDLAGVGEIDSIKPRRGTAVRGLANSPFVAVVRGGAGAVLSTTAMKVDAKEIEFQGSVTALLADVPATGAARVEIVRAGAVVAARARSAAAPRVRITAPRARATVGRAREVTVRWSATDADRDKLRIKIDYSRDGGRNWVPVHSGPNAGSARLPSGLLARSAKARLRVRANDGFRESAATSGVFTAVGRPPSVRILAPEARTRVGRDETVALSGQAYDDRRALIGNRRLRWFDGRRAIGTGARVSVNGLTPGNRTLRLVATDGFGRRGSASVRIRVVAVAPKFALLRPPARVARAARSFALRVASSIPATLRVAGQTFKVDRRIRSVRVKVRPGGAPLAFTARLNAGVRTTSAVLRIPRS